MKTERNKKILVLREKGLTIREVAKKMNISFQRVHQIEKREAKKYQGKMMNDYAKKAVKEIKEICKSAWDKRVKEHNKKVDDFNKWHKEFFNL